MKIEFNNSLPHLNLAARPRITCQSTIFAFGSTSQEETISIQKPRDFSYFRKAMGRQSPSVQEREAQRSRITRARRLLVGHIQARQMHSQWQNARSERC